MNYSHNFIDLQEKLESSSKSNPETTHNSYLGDLAFYIFTSGTTRFPKAALQNNFRSFNPLGYLAFQLTQEDVVYSALPLYHSLAVGVGWNGSVHAGATFTFRKWFLASEFWKDIYKFKATCFIYVGEIPRYLINRPKSEFVENTTLKKMLGVGLRKDIWD